MSKHSGGGIIYGFTTEGIAGVKIGSTTRLLAQRLSQFQSAYPNPIKILASVSVQRDLRDIETTIHAILRKDRIQREWFAVELDQLQLEKLVSQAIEWLEIATARSTCRGGQQNLFPQESAIQEAPAKEIPTQALPLVSMSIGDNDSTFTLRERLRELRRGKHLTQQDLQALSGVPYTTISRIETGMADEITTSTLRRLADALDVTTDYLLGVSDLPHGCLGEKP